MDKIKLFTGNVICAVDSVILSKNSTYMHVANVQIHLSASHAHVPHPPPVVLYLRM